MRRKLTLLVEGNPDDEALAIRALKKSNLANEIAVARAEVQALDFLFCEGSYAARDPHEPPVVVLLDLKLPKETVLKY